MHPSPLAQLLASFLTSRLLSMQDAGWVLVWILQAGRGGLEGEGQAGALFVYFVWNSIGEVTSSDLYSLSSLCSNFVYIMKL